MTAPDCWSTLPIWTFEILSPAQRAKLPPVKVWRRLLRESGLPFTARAVGLWASEYLSGSHRLGEQLDALADQDPDQWRRHFETWHAASTIAAHCGAGERTVRRAIDELEAAGWLHVRRTDLETGRQLRSMNRPHVLTITIPPLDPRSQSPEVEGGPPVRESGGADALRGHPRSESPGDPRSESPGDPRSESPVPPVTESEGSPKPPVRVTDELSSGFDSLQELPPGKLTVDASADVAATPTKIKTSPYELGRRYAGHVASGTMSVEDVEGIASHYSAEDRANFLEGFREGVAA